MKFKFFQNIKICVILIFYTCLNVRLCTFRIKMAVDHTRLYSTLIPIDGIKGQEMSRGAGRTHTTWLGAFKSLRPFRGWKGMYKKRRHDGGVMKVRSCANAIAFSR